MRPPTTNAVSIDKVSPETIFKIFRPAQLIFPSESSLIYLWRADSESRSSKVMFFFCPALLAYFSTAPSVIYFSVAIGR